MLVSATGDMDDTSCRQLLRAVRLALGRSAQQSIGLPLSVIGAKQARLGQGDLADVLPDGWLAVLLDGPQGQAGAVCLSPNLVSGMVQHLTMGQITGDETEDRRFTATDAALVSPVLQHMLEELTNQDDPSLGGVSGFGFGAAVGAATDLMLALSVEWYDYISLTVELGGGVLQGQAMLFFPELPQGDGSSSLSEAEPEGPTLEVAFDVTRADFRAVLCRMQMPLSDLLKMAPGDRLPLALGSFTRAELRAVTGDLVAVGRLGQINGQRAIRINENQPDMHPEMAEAHSALVPASKAEPAPQTAPQSEPQAELRAEPQAEPGTAPSPPALINDVAQLQNMEQAPDDLVLDKTGDELAAEISRLAGLSDVDPWEPTDAAPTG